MQAAQPGILKFTAPIGLLLLTVILIIASWFHWRSTLAATTPLVMPLSPSSPQAHTGFRITAKGLYKLYLEIPREQLPPTVIQNFGIKKQQFPDCVIHVALRNSTTAIFEANVTNLRASVLAPDTVRFAIGSLHVEQTGRYTSTVDIASLPSSLTASNSFFTVRRAASQAEMMQIMAAVRILFASVVAAASLLFAIKLLKGLRKRHARTQSGNTMS